MQLWIQIRISISMILKNFPDHWYGIVVLNKWSVPTTLKRKKCHVFLSIYYDFIKVIAEAKDDRQKRIKIAKNGLLCVTFMSVKEFSNVSNYFESSIQLANIFQLKSHCDWAILVCTGAFFLTFFIFSIRLFSALTLKSVL